MSCTFSKNIGSLPSLKRVIRSGRRPMLARSAESSCLIRRSSFAINRVLQWVRAVGFCSKVRVIISSTFVSLMRRGTPLRGASTKPESRSCSKRVRHFPNSVCRHSLMPRHFYDGQTFRTQKKNTHFVTPADATFAVSQLDSISLVPFQPAHSGDRS